MAQNILCSCLAGNIALWYSILLAWVPFLLPQSAINCNKERVICFRQSFFAKRNKILWQIFLIFLHLRVLGLGYSLMWMEIQDLCSSFAVGGGSQTDFSIMFGYGREIIVQAFFFLLNSWFSSPLARETSFFLLEYQGCQLERQDAKRKVRQLATCVSLRPEVPPQSISLHPSPPCIVT